MYYIMGLGNPGEEYKESRHNTGKMAVSIFSHSKLHIPSSKLWIIESGEFMNNSGRAVAKVIKSKAAAKKLIVVYDDIDLALGSIKISYNKGSGGHKGLESVVKAVKTKEFTRIRIGIAPTTPSGKVKKPVGEKKVLDFILGNFSSSQKEILKKVLKRVTGVIEMIVEEGKERAMNQFN